MYCLKVMAMYTGITSLQRLQFSPLSAILMQVWLRHKQACWLMSHMVPMPLENALLALLHTAYIKECDVITVILHPGLSAKHLELQGAR